MRQESIFPLQDFKAFLKERKLLDENAIKEVIDFIVFLTQSNPDKTLSLEELRKEYERLLGSAQRTLDRLRIRIEELR